MYFIRPKLVNIFHTCCVKAHAPSNLGFAESRNTSMQESPLAGVESLPSTSVLSPQSEALKLGSVTDVTRHISHPVQCLLWGRSAGRCELCNKPLWKSPVSQEQVKLAELAHIYSFGNHGPRGNKGIPKGHINNIANLILACLDCHTTIDKDTQGMRYSPALLIGRKQDHERRIENVTGIDPHNKSHVLHYGANVGDHSSPLNFGLTAPALFPAKYPVDDKAIELATINSSFKDRNPKFWSVESEELTAKFEQRVRERIAAGEVKHLSIFAFAPQPLLILLGSLLTDIIPADIYQLHREPQGWGWPENAKTIPFDIEEPQSKSGAPALVFSLSATVTPDRILAVLGQNVSIWKVRISAPHNDFLKTREQLWQFRSLIRPLLDRIKALHGQQTTLHIFPATPVAIAVELGRVRMPKADMPWLIYDQINAQGGFVPAINIPKGVEA